MSIYTLYCIFGNTYVVYTPTHGISNSVHTTRSYTHAETAHEYKAHTNTISSAQPGLPTMDSSVGTREGYSQGCLMNLLLREVRITDNVSRQSQHSAILHPYLFCEYFRSCLIYRSVIIFCVVQSLAFKAECVVYMKSERIFSFLWWKRSKMIDIHKLYKM